MSAELEKSVARVMAMADQFAIYFPEKTGCSAMAQRSDRAEFERVLREELLATQPQAPQGAVTRHCDTCGHMVSAPCRSVICSTRDTWKSAAAPETPEGKK